jgi:hypothetical protein
MGHLPSLTYVGRGPRLMTGIGPDTQMLEVLGTRNLLATISPSDRLPPKSLPRYLEKPLMNTRPDSAGMMA